MELKELAGKIAELTEDEWNEVVSHIHENYPQSVVGKVKASFKTNNEGDPLPPDPTHPPHP